MKVTDKPLSHHLKQIHLREDRAYALLALILYGLLALILTWPLMTQINTHLFGGRDDLWVHQWTFWWVKEAIATGQSPFFTPLLYYPNGVALYSHNFAWFNIALWLPLQAVVGQIAAYNLTILLILTLNGFALYLLAYTFFGHRLGAFTAGFIFMAWPYTLSHYDHPNMIVLFWPLFFMLFLHHLLKNGRWRDVVYTGFCLAMIGISRWQHLVMAFPLLFAFGLWQWWHYGHERQRLGQVMAAMALGLLLMLPVAWPVFANQLTRDYPEDIGLFEPDNGRSDLAAYFIPSPMHPIWGEQVRPFFAPAAASVDYIPFIGFITLALALLGAIKQWHQARFWLLMALIYVLLALGPELAVYGHVYPQIRLPYSLIEGTFIGDLLRRPHRLNLYLGIPVAMLAGWGAVFLANRRAVTKGNGRFLFWAVLIGLLLFEYSPFPFSTTQPTLPAWWAQQASAAGDFAVLDLPMQNRSYDKWYMLYQTVHQQPIVGGHVSRMPREAFDFINQVPLLAYAFANDSRADFALTAVTQQTRQLTATDIRYVIIHKKFANEGLQTMWRDWLTYNPIYEDEEVLVYHTDPTAGVDFSLMKLLADGIGLIRVNYTPAVAVQNGLIKIDARWGTTAVPQADYQVCLGLLAPNAAMPPVTDAAWQCEPLQAAMPTSTWQANEVVRSAYQLAVTDDLLPGDYQLHLALASTDSPTWVGETAVIGPVTIQSGQPDTKTDLQWDNTIRLNGFDQALDHDNLQLTFYWQIDQPLDDAYKLFIHVVRPADGQIVAQSDTIPRNWTYPTNIWETNEQVLDPVTLPFSEIPPGNYEIWIGWYDSLTGERVLIEGSERVQLTAVTRNE